MNREIRIELENPDAGLLDRVRSLPFVSSASLQDGALVVGVTREGDHRKELSQALIGLGLVPLSIEEKVPSLEEAFVTITQENVDALARGARDDSGARGESNGRAGALFLVIARRQVFESLVSPGFYVMLTVSLAVGAALAAGFAASVDTSGFDPTLSPLYGFLSRVIDGTFGTSFSQKLFAEGPLAFSLVASYLPVLVYLAFSSVFRFGHEKNAGAVELIVYGPANGTTYLIAAFLKDVALCFLSLAPLAAAMIVAGLLVHVLPGRLFATVVTVLPLACLPVFAYGALCSTVTSNATSALALFIGIQLLFVLLLVGSFAIVSEQVRSASSIAAALLQWVSPLYYSSVCFRAAEAAQAAGFAAGCALLLGLSGVLLAVGHVVIR